MEDTSIQTILDDLLDPDTTGETDQRIRETLIRLIWQADYQAKTQDMRKALEQDREARARGDKEAQQAAADRYEELLLQRCNPSMIKMSVVEIVLRQVTDDALEALRRHLHQTGHDDLLPVIEAGISLHLKQIMGRIYEQSTLDPTADQSSSMVS
jgi:hypothetical protein